MRRCGCPASRTWQRVLDTGILTDEQAAIIKAQIADTNPADLTRQITRIQNQLIDLAATKTQALLANQSLELDSLQSSINRMTTKPGKPAPAQSK